MKKVYIFSFLLLLFLPCMAGARNVVSRAARVTNTPTSGYTYNYMYPYLNNQMRSTLNPGNTNAQSTSPINVVVKTVPFQNNQNRGVVARTARSATSTTSKGVSGGGATMARTGGGTYTSANASNGTNRRVAQRRAVSRTIRSDASDNNTNSSSESSIYVSSSRCLADYSECMNTYCMREDTPYNRCFCSSRLSQIESTYQPQIDSLVKRILRAKGAGLWTDAEMAEYWYEKMGQYVGENTWEKLNDALNIDWPDANLRMSGQNAYLTGHQYCIQHLKNCGYAVANMRDVYRSEISRDCTNYEKSLERLKTALKTVLETYSE